MLIAVGAPIGSDRYVVVTCCGTAHDCSTEFEGYDDEETVRVSHWLYRMLEARHAMLSHIKLSFMLCWTALPYTAPYCTLLEASITTLLFTDTAICMHLCVANCIT